MADTKSIVSCSSSNRSLVSTEVNPKFKSHSSKKISSLYEVEYSEENKIQPTQLPLVNPYLAYQKSSSSIIRSIKSLIHSPPKSVKEYVQSSKFDKHYITGSTAEQFVTLEILPEFPKRWIEAGYSHIHFGAIRLALNYHGVEGKPVVARIALLDTRYLKYQDACIGTVEASMNNGLVMVTLFPNFTMALEDPNLTDALKVQIHIIGAQQVESSIIATLHYQIVYRVQDHAFWLGGCGSNDSLFIIVNTQEQPHCMHIPRQIPKEDLIQLLPEKWITNYEQIHATRQPVMSTNNKIISKGDGTSEIKFDHSHLKDSPTPPIFPTQMMMTPMGDPTQEHSKDDPDCWCDLCNPGAKASMIEKFDAEGKPILYFRNPITGHCPWDEECSCEQCVEEAFVQEIEGGHHTIYNPHKKGRKKKKNSIHSQLYRRWMNRDPTVGPLGEDHGRFVFLVDYGPKVKEEKPALQSPPPESSPPDPSPPPPIRKEKPVQHCYKKIQKWIKKNPEAQKDPLRTNPPGICMFSPAGSSYNKDFPPLEEFTEKEYDIFPKFHTAPRRKVAQMDTKITMVETKVDSNTKIANELIVSLHRMLREAERRPAEPGQDLYHIEQKTQEIQRLKDHIKYLQEHGLPSSAHPEESLFPSMSRAAPTSVFSPFTKREPPSPPNVFNYHTTEPKRLTPYELREYIRKQKAEQKRNREERGKVQKKKEAIIPRIDVLNIEETEPSQQSSESDCLDDSQSSTTQNSSEDEIFMAVQGVKTEEFDPMDTDASPSTTAPPPFQINNGKHIFTLDDIPSTR
ncbi:hypothetical protein V6N11_010388 [Hibiscus sabdariffa]|uniref:Uncharacterized protein n=1 Tax=Hibiscus sabdariffa TaxID=183260 RepID=A0ABR2S605_9ROSI